MLSDLIKNKVILNISWSLLYFLYNKKCDKYVLLYLKCVWETTLGRGTGGIRKGDISISIPSCSVWIYWI